MSEKAGPLNAMAYAISRGAGALKKVGSPKMQVYLTMCMKTKGEKNGFSRMSNDVDENKRLVTLSDDVDEKKVLSSPAALAQRAMLSGFAGNSLFAATRVYLAKRRLEAASARAPLRPAGCRAQLCDSSLSSTNIAEFHSALASQCRRTGNRQLITTPPPHGRTVADVESGGTKRC